MRTLEMKVDALMRLCTAEEEGDRDRIRTEVRELLKNQRKYCPIPDPEYLIRELLLELGAPDHLVGHPYTVQAILLVVQDRTYIDSITFGLYPQLAVMFDTTASRVERAIRHLIEVTWARGDWDTLNRYFGNTVSAEKGKPTNGEFIARTANIVRQRLREAA
jgi:two-component system response regulator (stage 0 sporulation protein A)